MKHLNSNLLCAVAIKTTGSVAGIHKILEIAIIPLTKDCKVSREILPFNILFKVDEIDIRRAEYNLDNDLVLKCMSSGFEYTDGADLLEKWFEKLQLRFFKKIMILSHNWAFKRPFIENWLQPTGYNLFFHHEYRDPQAVGLFLNDRYDVKNEPYPFAKVKLSYMCATQKLEYESRLPTVIDECAATISLYKSLICSGIF